MLRCAKASRDLSDIRGSTHGGLAPSTVSEHPWSDQLFWAGKAVQIKGSTQSLRRA